MKILFRIPEGAEDKVESMWASMSEGGYKIDNIPFYAIGIALGDTVAVSCAEDGILRFDHLVSCSGHSTVRLWFATEEDVAGVREELREMGCSSELDLNRLVAVDIPPDLDYGRMREYFEGLEAKGLLEYEEGCLGQE